MRLFFNIASVTGLHGLNGYVKIKSNPLAEFALADLAYLYIDIFGDKRKVVIEDSLGDTKVYALKFKNFDDCEASSYLVGCDLYLDSAQINKYNELKIFFKAIGSSVVYNDEVIGLLKDILFVKNNNLLVVEKDNNEVLIPFNDYFVDYFDEKLKKLFIKNFDALKFD